MNKLAVLLVLVGVAACGGKKGGSTTPPPTEESTKPDNSGTGGEPMVSADQMEEIQKMFQRKGNAVSRCLSMVVDNKELPKNSRGKVTVEVTISPSGKPENVKIIKSTLESKPLHDCVLERVKEIGFPAVPNTYPTTYTYAFEAM